MFPLLDFVWIFATDEFREGDHGVCADDSFLVVESVHESVTKFGICIFAAKIHLKQNTEQELMKALLNLA